MNRKIIYALAIIFIVLLAGAGCGKKQDIEEKAKETGAKVFQKMKTTAHQDNLLYLKNKINTYKRQNGKYPDSLQKLVDQGFIDKIPEPPAGMQYQYDPSTGAVTLK